MTCNAFVLGGGGVLGAAEVGMARALLEAGVRPDLVSGTSIGAINGAALAADPTPGGVERLLAIWDTLANDGVLDGSLIRRVAEVMGRRTSLHGNDILRDLYAIGYPRTGSKTSPCHSSAWRPASNAHKSTGSTLET